MQSLQFSEKLCTELLKGFYCPKRIEKACKVSDFQAQTVALGIHVERYCLSGAKKKALKAGGSRLKGFMPFHLALL